MKMIKNKACVIVDSSSGINNGEINNVFMTPLHIIETNENGEEKQYRDLVDINTKQVIDIMDKNKSSLKSSQSSLGEILTLLEDLTTKYEVIYVWPISKGLSSSYSTWMMAKDEFPNADINVIDTGHINIGIKCMVEQISLMIDQNKSKEEILLFIDKYRKNWQGVLLVNDLTQLKKGGRINSFKAFIATALKLNILITYNGKLEFLDKEKNLEKAIQIALDKIDKETQFRSKGIKDCYLYTTYKDESKNKELLDIASKVMNYKIEKWYYLPAVIALHTGSGTFAIFIESNVE